MKGIKIRKMEIGDIPHVLEIEKKCFTTPWSEDALVTEIKSNKLAHYFVGILDDKVIGYGGMWFIFDESHITNIAVHPDFQGYGVGEAITRALIDEARSNEINRMTLEVRKSNIVAQNLYKKLGFKLCGVRPEYYDDNREDAYIMWKDIKR
ncbi:MAG: ribosomal protein S18-alanine N-acetyltransferase [Clostridiales bacterium]|nr:ribosomal protein S18-alanine N-acetyltransferase [Clostridiales bacterium]